MTDYSKSGDERKSKERLVRELKSLREKVADTDRLLAELIRNYKEAPIGLCVFDLNLRYVHINDWLAEINGVPAEEHLGRTVREVIPDVAAGVEPEFRHVIETGEPVLGGTVEAKTRALPGIERTFRHNYFPVKSGDATVVGVSCVVEDVTAQKWSEVALREARDELERRVEERTTKLETVNTYLLGEIAERERTEKELRESEARLKDAQRIAKLGHSIWDEKEDREVYSSGEGQRIFGVPQGWFAKDSDEFLTLVDPDDRERVRAVMKLAREDRTGFEIEYKIVRPDGGSRYVHEVAEVELDEAGELARTISTIQDITERKQAEDRLRQPQKMEAMGQLTGGVAHDFNNLLAVIMGNTELLQDQLGAENKLLQVIIRAVGRGAELTQRLLAFSRQQPLKPQAVDLGVLVGEMGDLLRRTLGETIQVEIASEPGLWHAQADPSQLENALLNLALNARDAMHKGGKLSIESSNATLDEAYADSHTAVSPGDYVLVSVSDSGAGMSAEVQAHALEPFFTTKEVGEGSGLGLPMVYGFAKQSGGDLVIYSQEGLGTTIKLYIPRAVDSGDRAEPSAKTEMPRGQGETVLVVEDESEVRALAEAVLGSLGYRVLTAKDGREGLEILGKEPKIDLLLSDVVLPGGMSGPDFAKDAMRRVSELKVLFMSGYAESLVHHHSLLPEGADLLNKPFRMPELAQMVRAALDH